jgi:hypothetical protein
VARAPAVNSNVSENTKPLIADVFIVPPFWNLELLSLLHKGDQHTTLLLCQIISVTHWHAGVPTGEDALEAPSDCSFKNGSAHNRASGSTPGASMEYGWAKRASW